LIQGRSPADMANVLTEHSRRFAQLRFAYPVVSRRSKGLSLGLNVNPDKVCNFDCPYCQVDRTVPGADRTVDYGVMIREIDELMGLAASGEIWQQGKFADTPAHLRRFNDIAFAGDGEPTTYPRLGDAIREVHALKQRHGLPDVKTIVLTNATLLGRADVLAALEGLKLGPYELWAKLDAGTQPWFELVSGTKLQLSRMVTNIAKAAAHLEITIQCMVPTIDGRDPGEAEMQAIAGRIREIEAAGKVRLVQVYTTARRPASDRIGMVPDARLNELAEVVRQGVSAPVEAYFGRHWDE
jgi:wyosine [tRNA(Phe)-imidazoG37] synthetase (radical SAM superfamily)